MFGLIGANGAGKSTILKTLLGYLRQYEGDVKVFGHDMRSLSEVLKAKIGYMPETSFLW